MLAQHRYDLRFRPFALLHCPKVQMCCGFVLSHAPDLGEAYTASHRYPHQRRSFRHATQRTTHALGLSDTGHLPGRALYRLVGNGGVVGGHGWSGGSCCHRRIGQSDYPCGYVQHRRLLVVSGYRVPGLVERSHRLHSGVRSVGEERWLQSEPIQIGRSSFTHPFTYRVFHSILSEASCRWSNGTCAHGPTCLVWPGMDTERVVRH
jgi:hypothetical protein